MATEDDLPELPSGPPPSNLELFILMLKAEARMDRERTKEVAGALIETTAAMRAFTDQVLAKLPGNVKEQVARAFADHTVNPEELAQCCLNFCLAYWGSEQTLQRLQSVQSEP